MKNALVLCLFLLCAQCVAAQSPQLSVKGPEAALVKLSRLKVDVKIAGNIAYTTAEMHFTNNSNRQMEAELLFPLPEGVSVSRYAIDINGALREAVPVNKNKGKQVFEAIEHRRVDPGLLEKVQGNNFKTRIYPLPPNGGERTVLIGYEEELSNLDKENLRYNLVSKYGSKLDLFELNITVLGAIATPSLINEDRHSGIENVGWTPAHQASIRKTDYQPAENFLLKIPIREDLPSVITQSAGGQHYFYTSTLLDGSRIAKRAPNSIGLVWDVSLSCKNRDLQKELQLLDAYFARVGHTSVTLYFLSYYFERKETFEVSNGEWSRLRRALETAVYDGGTRYSQIAFPDVLLANRETSRNALSTFLPAQEEYLFFTDGLSTLSTSHLPRITRPVYTINSSVSADFSFLNYLAVQSGGHFINLAAQSTQTALNKLVYQSLRFLGIKENYSITDVYPMAGTPAQGSFSVAGISLNPSNELTLLFGYGNKPTLEKKVRIDVRNQETQEVNIEKLWAQKKIADLELRYTKNAEEIEVLGKRYGIVTQNTSLIVLENINDYLAYDIVPPAALRAEYDLLVKQRGATRAVQQKSNWGNVATYYEDLNSWWNRNLKLTGSVRPVPGGKGRVNAPQPAPDDRIVERRRPTESLKEDEVAAPAAVTVTQNAPQFTPSQMRDEKSRAEYSAASPAPPPQPPTDVPARSRIAAGRAAAKSSVLRADMETDQEENEVVGSLQWRSARVKTSTWNPDRAYLKVISAAPAAKRYAIYLQLREGQEGNPAYYFDVAHAFYNAGDRKTALLILSNIADLGLENHQLYKTLTYTLRQWAAYEDALYTAGQIVKWRAHEPQSHRDLGLALEDNGKYQAAFDELVAALEVNYFGEMSGQYAGVEDIILMDLNRLAADHPEIRTGKLDAKYLKKLPVAVRVILNWNQMDTDLDMHVTEPTGEECYYGHRDTEAGARFSKDFTQGYGPEQYLLRNAVKGKYQIKTNYFGETKLTENGPATVMVEIYTRNASGKTERKLKTVQLGTVKEHQVLAEVVL